MVTIKGHWHSDFFSFLYHYSTQTALNESIAKLMRWTLFTVINIKEEKLNMDILPSHTWQIGATTAATHLHTSKSSKHYRLWAEQYVNMLSTPALDVDQGHQTSLNSIEDGGSSLLHLICNTNQLTNYMATSIYKHPVNFVYRV